MTAEEAKAFGLIDQVMDAAVRNRPEGYEVRLNLPDSRGNWPGLNKS